MNNINQNENDWNMVDIEAPLYGNDLVEYCESANLTCHEVLQNLESALDALQHESDEEVEEEELKQSDLLECLEDINMHDIALPPFVPYVGEVNGTVAFIGIVPSQLWQNNHQSRRQACEYLLGYESVQTHKKKIQQNNGNLFLNHASWLEQPSILPTAVFNKNCDLFAYVTLSDIDVDPWVFADEYQHMNNSDFYMTQSN